MQRELDGSDERRLRLVTGHGYVDGQLRANAGVSTLHYLNVSAATQAFVVVQPPIQTHPEWGIESGELALSVSSILFVQELSKFVPVPGDRQAAAQFRRSPVRLNVGDYSVEGFVHLPPGGDAFSRLNNDRHPFFALSSASILGPDTQFSAAFLAVKRDKVLALQSVADEMLTGDQFRAEETSAVS